MSQATPSKEPVATTAPTASPAAARAWRYDAVIDEQLTTLTVTVCFEGASPTALIPGQTFGYEYLREPVLLRGVQPPEPLPVTKQGIVLPAGADDACVRYDVAVDEAADAGDRDAARRVGGDVVLTHDVWLWRPSSYADDAVITATLTAPPPIAISTPWRAANEEEPARYDVPRSTLQRPGYTAFGRFRVQDLKVPGGTLHVAVLGGGLDHGHAPVLAWLSNAGRAVAQLYGEFPREHTQVMVSPSPVGRGALFGWVVRGGGSSVNLLIGRWSDEEALALDDEWIAVHEMSHLAIPHVALGEPWLSEGLATWYQNVLRVRSGDVSEREAWQKLLEGFGRGRGGVTGRTLLEDSQQMRETRSFGRVYWAGTALVMLADVEIRRATNGASSLDSALEELARCCLDSDATMTALELTQRIDEATGGSLFTDIARAGREQRRFPDVDGVLRGLGVIDVRGRLVLDDEAPLAHIRRQIMSPREVLP